MNKNTRKRKRVFNLDLTISIVIIVLLVVMVGSVERKERLMLEDSSDPMNIYRNRIDEIDNSIEEPLREAFENFRKSDCGMIEAYDENLQLTIRCGFNKAHDHSGEDDLTQYPDLAEILLNNHEGHTSVELDNGSIEHIYFWWDILSNGESRLIMFYNNVDPPHTLMNIEVNICIIALMVGVLLIRNMFLKEKYDIRVYEDMSKDIQTSLLKQKNL